MLQGIEEEIIYIIEVPKKKRASERERERERERVSTTAMASKGERKPFLLVGHQGLQIMHFNGFSPTT